MTKTGLGTLTLFLLLVAAEPGTAHRVGAPPGSPEPSAGSVDEEKKTKEKKSKRGKSVKATLIKPASPSSASSDQAPVEADESPAAVSSEEPAASSIAAPTEPTTERSGADTPVFGEKVDVIEVLLDVLVTDGKGDVVAGLGVDDFVIEEEGQPVEIGSATFYGGEDELHASGTEGERRSDRYFMILFHDRTRDAPFTRGPQIEASRAAKRWVEEELLPNDQVAVLTWNLRLKIYSDFTRDREQVIEAIGRASIGKKEQDRGYRRSEAPRRETGSPSLLVNLPPPKELDRETRVFEQGLEVLGRAAEGIVGRKNLVLFSIGFGETRSAVWTPDSRYYPDMEKSLNSGNVAVYALDLMGSRGGGGSGPLASSMSSITSDTGGIYYQNFGNFGNVMREVTDDNKGYYLLSYRSEYPASTSGYRDVKVQAKDKSLELRYRRGYRYGEEAP